MAGSFFRSMPQIIKIVRRGTTEGLSMTSSVVELMCYSVILAYHYHHGYHPSTYCELVACWVQDVVLVALQCHYRRIPGAIVCVTAAAFMAMCVVLGWPGLVPPVLLAGLQLSTLFAMALGSRLPQIVLNVRRGNAGVLSLTTSALNVTGNIIRLFTNLTLTHDPLLLLGSCTQGVLNGVILSQVLRTRLAEHAKQGSGPAALGTFEEVADEVPAPANAHGTVGGRWLGAPT